MDYKKLEENVIRHLDSMSDEELQADFDRHVERVDKWAKENPDAAEALGYDIPNDVKELMKRSSEMRKEKKTDNDPEPTALAKSPFPTREELDELNEIGIAGVIKKRERQARWDAVWFWVMVSLSSVCGGVVGTVLYRWLRG